MATQPDGTFNPREHGSEVFNLSWKQQRYYDEYKFINTMTFLESLKDFAELSYMDVSKYNDNDILTHEDMKYENAQAKQVKKAYRQMLTAVYAEMSHRSEVWIPWKELKGQIDKRISQLQEKSKKSRQNVKTVENNQAEMKMNKSKRAASPPTQKESLFLSEEEMKDLASDDDEEEEQHGAAYFLKEKPNSQRQRTEEEKESFVTPKKICRVASPKKIQPTVIKNKFEGLRAVAPDDNVEMDTTQVPEKTITRLPPIVLRYEGNPEILLEELASLSPEEIGCRCHGDELKLTVKDIQTYDKIKETLQAKGVKFYSQTPKHRRPLKVVVKGIPTALKPSKVQSMFQQANFEVETVTRLYEPAIGKSPPPFVLTLQNKEENLAILQIKKLTFFKVRLERLKKRKGKVVICYKCQDVGHTSHGCHRDTACRHCGGNHATTLCDKKEEAPKCARCRGAHKATDPACPALKENNAFRDSKKVSHTKKKSSLSTQPISKPPSKALTTQKPGCSYADVAAGKKSAEKAVPEADSVQSGAHTGAKNFMDEILQGFCSVKVANFVDAFTRLKNATPAEDRLYLQMEAAAAFFALKSP